MPTVLVDSLSTRRRRERPRIDYKTNVISGQADPTAPASAGSRAATGADDDLPQALADSITDLLHKPRARGWIHLCSAAIAIVAGAALVAVAWTSASPKAGWATLIYTAAIVAMFSASAVYHRVRWDSPTAQKWMKRVDHSVIFIFIAGSYTPFAL